MPDTGFTINVSPDRMTVTVAFTAGAAVTAAAVIAALREQKLASFDDGVVMEALGGSVPAEPIVVATGRPPVAPRPAKLDLCVPVADATAATVAKVEAGQVVAEFCPAVAGKDGADVFGQSVAAVADAGEPEIGRNLTAEKGVLSAKCRGNLRLRGNVLSVEPLLEIHETDANAAPVEFDGDAVVKGVLSEGRVLAVTGCVTVAGALEAVQLKCGGSLNVKGGLLGKQKGRYWVGGDLRCRFISAGTIYVGGDVHAQSEVINTRLVCAGRVNVAHGPIYGGTVAANGGILCKSLGHPSGTPTIVEVGESDAVMQPVNAQVAQIAANNSKVGLVRAKIEPLLRNMRQLTAVQKERATELLYEADEIEGQTKRMSAEVERRRAAMRERAAYEVRVTEALHAGVTIRLGSIETILVASLQGPLVITTRKRELVTEVVLVEQGTRSCIVLPSHAVASATTPPASAPQVNSVAA
jgi:uncharacterized protein (DUF342 family)